MYSGRCGDLAYTNLAPCDEERALRLFAAEELVEIGVTPSGLMEAQGFDSAPLDLSKANFNPAQLRWPAGDGRDSGRWSGGASVDSAGVKEFIARLALEAARRAARSLLSSKTKPTNPEIVKPLESLESDLPRPGYGQEVPIPGLPDTIRGTDTTDSDARMANYKLDLSRSEFEDELSKLGWAKEPSPDEKVLIYTKDGSKYIVRDDAKSTDGPTADFYHPLGDGKVDMKLRLRSE